MPPSSGPYGCLGCRCTAYGTVDDGGWIDGPRWTRNLDCPHHGDGRDLSQNFSLRLPVMCPPGVHSMFDPCPGDCADLLPDDEPIRRFEDDVLAGRVGGPILDDEEPGFRHLEPGPVDLDTWENEGGTPGGYTEAEPEGVDSAPATIEEERGVLATVRRWWRRFTDWLDPHARYRRDYAEFMVEWRRDQRAREHGGEPRPPR